MTAIPRATTTIAHWPPYLTTRRALAYTGRSRTTINRAVAAGILPVYGRPGGARGERVFATADLARWMAGDLTPTTARPARPAIVRGRSASADTTAALARLDAIRKGDRR